MLKRIMFVNPPIEIHGDVGTLSELYALNNNVGGLVMHKRAAPIPLSFLLIGLDYEMNLFRVNVYEYNKLFGRCSVPMDDDQIYTAFKVIDGWIDNQEILRR